MIDIERIRKATARIRDMHTPDDVFAIVQEECGELITEIAREQRGRSNLQDVAFEAIDCIVVCVSLLDMLSQRSRHVNLGELVESKMQQVEGYRR